MYSGLVRIQNTFGFFSTIVSVVAGFIAISSFFFPQHPTADLILRDIKVARGKPHYYSTRREEYAHVKFTLDMGKFSLPHLNP
jgi:signal peptidase complex subunit 3